MNGTATTLDASPNLLEIGGMTGPISMPKEHFNGDRQSDLAAWAVIIILLVLSAIIEGRSAEIDLLRSGVTNPDAAAKEWLYEISSHLTLAIAALIIPKGLNLFPVSVSNALSRLPVIVLGFTVFTLIHVIGMVAIRMVVWSLLFEGEYVFGLMELEPWLYEAQKDLFSYIIIVATFLSARHIGQLKEDIEAARMEAKTTGQLSLRSGGRVITLPASDVLYAKSAGNYVELHTMSGHHFVRLTLAELETLLAEAQVAPLRLHRSYLTVNSRLREIGPKEAVLENGARLPVGRSFRDQLKALA